MVDKFDEWSIGHKDYYGAVRCRIHPSVKSILMEEGALGNLGPRLKPWWLRCLYLSVITSHNLFMNSSSWPLTIYNLLHHLLSSVKMLVWHCPSTVLCVLRPTEATRQENIQQGPIGKKILALRQQNNGPKGRNKFQSIIITVIIVLTSQLTKAAPIVMLETEWVSSDSSVSPNPPVSDVSPDSPISPDLPVSPDLHDTPG